MSLIIKKSSILKMTGENHFIKQGYIKIEDDKICSISDEMPEIKSNDTIIDGSDTVALPGFINTHTHCSMTLLRGYGEGLPLMRWLNEKIWPFENKLTPEDIYLGSKLAALEMIKSGTTCFADMYFFEDMVCKAIDEAGIRAVLGIPIMGEDFESRIEKFVKFYKTYNNSCDGRVNVMIAPHAPYTCSENALKEVSKTANSLNCGVHIHIAETMDEVDKINEKYGQTPIEFVNSTGIFNCGGVIAAHCVHIDDWDINIMKEHGITAVNCPQSNMKLASGISPVWKMMNQGINVSLGTDGTSSNNNLDMIEEMQTASYLQKLLTKDATALPAYKCLEMATINGAKALRMDNQIGLIKEGMKADIVLIDMSRPHMVPCYDIPTNIVYSGSGRDVKTVIANGNIVMKNYEVITLDEEKIKYDVIKRVDEILKK